MHNIKVGDKVKHASGQWIGEVLFVGKELAVVDIPQAGESSYFISNLIALPRIEKEYFINKYVKDEIGYTHHSSKSEADRNKMISLLRTGVLHLYKMNDGKWYVEELPIDKT